MSTPQAAGTKLLNVCQDEAVSTFQRPMGLLLEMSDALLSRGKRKCAAPNVLAVLPLGQDLGQNFCCFMVGFILVAPQAAAFLSTLS